MTKAKLEDKKYMILNMIRLGLEKYKAYIYMELTDDQIQTLDKDDKFQYQIKATEVELEQNLLEKYEQIIEKSTARGNPNAIQWMLSKINPKRWGNQISVGDEANKGSVTIILPSNGR